MKNIFVVPLVLMLASCVANNSYQSFNNGVGYKSEETEPNVYTVSYTGTRTTKTEKVNDFALLRCAEITLEKGFSYFVITEATNNRDVAGRGANVNVGSVFSDASKVGLQGGGTFNSSVGPSVSTQPRPVSTLVIHLFHEQPETISYDAYLIDRSLKDEYQIAAASASEES